MRKNAIISLLSLALTCGLQANAATEIDLYPDTWVAIDALDRVLPTFETQPVKTDKERIVSIFYITWHDDDKYNTQCPSDVSKILNEDPTARLDPWHRLWIERTCHWGEPENGYFLSRDKYVIRKDISMLTDAGVDVLVLDGTNGVAYFEEWDTLFEVMHQMQAEGNKVPQICFWVYNGKPARCANWIFDRYYRPGRHSDLWFYWDGKPLFLYNQKPPENDDPERTDAIYGEDFLNFFTLRNMWWGYNYDFDRGETALGVDGNWFFGYEMHDAGLRNKGVEKRVGRMNGRNEMMAVTPAQHANTMVGKSWTIASGEPGLNQYDMPTSKIINRRVRKNPENYGLYFQERWDEALSIDPDMIYLNDWNEWTAGMFCTHTDNFMGRANDMFFVDQYNAEFNRTISPAKEGYTDNYYMQMIDNIRRYKGVRQAPVALSSYNIPNPSAWSAWNMVTETFYDTNGDVVHRDNHGYGHTHYVNTSGRNDILLSKVAVDGNNLLFYVETADNLTPSTDPNWMMLLINADRDFATGWHGFDFIINRSIKSETETTLEAYDKEAGQWKTVTTLTYSTEGNKLVITVPMSALGIEPSNEGGIYFKWTDNPQALNNILDLCTDGDTAPNRRFAYNFSWNIASSGIDIPTSNSPFKATGLYGEIRVDSSTPFVVYNLSGIEVARADGASTVSVPGPGLYIVSSPKGSSKITVY
ncbi:MAG: hypothetical protein NC343_03195 [Muribaculum sp.]|nr:hypothetical protein [Muribaculaceae bacterium]MCM1080734.1 hypothetical protein [Muribaculum sp.]